MKVGWGLIGLLLAVPAAANPERRAEVIDFCLDVHASRIADSLVATREEVAMEVSSDPSAYRMLEEAARQTLVKHDHHRVRRWERLIDWSIGAGIDPEFVYRETKRKCLKGALGLDGEGE